MEASSAAGGDRPRLAVVYGHRSLDLMQICDGARGWCDLVWLVDGEDPSAMAMRPILRRFGEVVDALGGIPARAAAALRAHSPDGLATFYDAGMERVAAVADELGLPFHSLQAARNLEDKLYQRGALRASGLPTPITVALPERADLETVERMVDRPLSGGVEATPGVRELAHVPCCWRGGVLRSVGLFGDGRARGPAA